MNFFKCDKGKMILWKLTFFLIATLLGFCNIGWAETSNSVLKCNIEAGLTYKMYHMRYGPYEPYTNWNNSYRNTGVGLELVAKWFLCQRLDLELQYDYFQFKSFPKYSKYIPYHAQVEDLSPHQVYIGGEFYFYRGKKLMVSAYAGTGSFLSSPVLFVWQQGLSSTFQICCNLQTTIRYGWNSTYGYRRFSASDARVNMFSGAGATILFTFLSPQDNDQAKD